MSLFKALPAAASLEDEPSKELTGSHLETLSPQNSIQDTHDMRFLKVVAI